MLHIQRCILTWAKTQLPTAGHTVWANTCTHVHMHNESGSDLTWTGPLTPPPPSPHHNNPQRLTDSKAEHIVRHGQEPHIKKEVSRLTSRVALWSRCKEKLHDCSGLFQSWYLCISQLWQTGTETGTGSTERSSAQHTLEAEKAVELRRPRARSLTLCLLRMKREDFITAQTTPLPLQPLSSQARSLPPLCLHYLPASLPHSQPVAQALSQPREGEQAAKENLQSHRLLVPCSARTEKKSNEEEDGETEMSYSKWFEYTESYLLSLDLLNEI